MRAGGRKRKRKEIKKQARAMTVGLSTAVFLSSIGIITSYSTQSLIADKGVKTDESVLPSEIKEITKEIISANSLMGNKWYISDVIEEGYVQLVNRDNKLSNDYKPSDLVVPNIKFNGNVANKSVRKDVAMALELMFSDAKKEGVELLGVSGYRSYAYQDSLYKNKVNKKGKAYADKYVAVAGASEHQLGLVMDLVSSDYRSLDAGFAKSDGFKWLEKNMNNYGFILRYEKGKESITGYAFEPWHLRYVGTDVAKYIGSNGLTLEEYLGK